jgi:hypothetical protein
MPQECHTRQNAICCTSEGEVYGYAGIFYPFTQYEIDQNSPTGVEE